MEKKRNQIVGLKRIFCFCLHCLLSWDKNLINHNFHRRRLREVKFLWNSLPHNIQTHQNCKALRETLEHHWQSFRFTTCTTQKHCFMYRSLLLFQRLTIAFTQTHSCHFSHNCKFSQSFLSSTSTCRSMSTPPWYPGFHGPFDGDRPYQKRFFRAQGWGLCALCHGIQISMEAIMACHPARSTE